MRFSTQAFLFLRFFGTKTLLAMIHNRGSQRWKHGGPLHRLRNTDLQQSRQNKHSLLIRRRNAKKIDNKFIILQHATSHKEINKEIECACHM